MRKQAGRYFAVLSALCLTGSTFAQVVKTEAAVPPPKDTAKQAPKEAEKPKTFEELTKDFTKLDGVFTVYRQTKGLTDTVYLEVPESRLGQLLLVQVTSGSGLGDTSSASVFHGQPLGDIPARFNKIGDARLQLVSPNLSHRGSTAESKRGIARSFPDTILETFEIKAKSAERNSLLIDVSGFFKSDFAEVSQAVNGYGIDPSGTLLDTVKDFPENLVVRTVYKLNRKSPTDGSPKSVPWAVSYSLSMLPESDFKPRVGDPRVGYFTSTFQDLTDAREYRDVNVNYITRWNLKKANPELPLSPPVKPIVFWIDNAVPQEYRASVRKGLLMYNPAFEAIGIKDAIQVKQMPDDADWDIADLRYNTIRWTTGMPFAIALFRVNPLTGEILNACINMDAGFASSGAVQFDQIVDPGSYFAKPAKSVASKYAYRLCDLMSVGNEQRAVGATAVDLLSQSPAERQKYIEEFIAETVAHEFGHCLGLRHNFIASTEFGPAALSDAKTVATHGIGSSVMDYNLYNPYAIGKKGVDYYSQTIGDYDKWAIEYGYREIASNTPSGEHAALQKIASLGSLPGHEYQSDGAADDFDPYVTRFDMSSDPVAVSNLLVRIGRKLRVKADSKLQNGDSYYSYTLAWLRGLSAQLSGGSGALRYLGGGLLSSSFVGDKGGRPPYMPVDAVSQQRALKTLVDGLFLPDSFALKSEDLARLTFNPDASGNEVDARARLYPIRTRLAAVQAAALASTLSADVLTRIKGNEFRVGPTGDTLTLVQLFSAVTKAVWSEVDAKKPVGDLRRELQRTHLDLLTSMALGKTPGTPYDAKALSLEDLKSLRFRISQALPSAKDTYTRAHLNACLTRIDGALNAHITAQ